MTILKFFIGGPSQCGKTTTAKLFCEQSGFVLCEVDKDAEIKDIYRTFRGSDRVRRVKERCKVLISEISVNAVVEGGPLQPQEVYPLLKHDPALLCAYCGYPNVEPEIKLQQLERVGFKDARHFRILSDQDRLKAVEKYIAISRDAEKECAKLGISYFDYSDIENLGQAQNEMATYLMEQVARIKQQPKD